MFYNNKKHKWCPIDFKMFIKAAFKSKLFDDTPEGDFISDAYADKNFKTFKTEKALVSYLDACPRVCNNARLAGRNVFKMWKKSHGSIKHISWSNNFGKETTPNRRLEF